MFSFLRSLRRRPAQSRSHGLESLEDRTLPAITLTISGNLTAPSVRIDGDAGNNSVVLSGYQLSSLNPATRFNVNNNGNLINNVANFSIPHLDAGLLQLNVNLGAGNDSFLMSGMRVTLLNIRDGGAGQHDTVGIVGESLTHSADIAFAGGTPELFVQGGTGPGNVINYLKVDYTNTVTSRTVMESINGNTLRLGNINIASAGNGADMVTMSARNEQGGNADFNAQVRVSGPTNINLAGGGDQILVEGNCNVTGGVTFDLGAGDDSVYTYAAPSLNGPLGPSFDRLNIFTRDGADRVEMHNARMGSAYIDMGTAANNTLDQFYDWSCVTATSMFVLSSSDSDIEFIGTVAKPVQIGTLVVQANRGTVKFLGSDISLIRNQGTIASAFVIGTGAARISVIDGGAMSFTRPLSLSNARIVWM